MRQLRAKADQSHYMHAKYAAIQLAHSTMNLADSLLPVNTLTCLSNFLGLLLLAFSLLVHTNVINLVFGTHPIHVGSTCDHIFDHTET